MNSNATLSGNKVSPFCNMVPGALLPNANQTQNRAEKQQKIRTCRDQLTHELSLKMSLLHAFMAAPPSNVYDFLLAINIIEQWIALKAHFDWLLKSQISFAIHLRVTRGICPRKYYDRVTRINELKSSFYA